MTEPTIAYDERLVQLQDFLAVARRIVFLTGAGMSTESGIPDFRSATGLYASGVGEAVFDIAEFRRNPRTFYDFGRNFLRSVRAAQPNAGHLAIASLARLPGKDVRVITQNIDLLHQEAGSPFVYPVHGTLEFSTCVSCGARVRSETLWPEVAAGNLPRHAYCDGVFKPDVVFFGEMLPVREFAAASQAIQLADLLVVAGTSLAVYPAAGLPSERRPECRLVILNQSATPLDGEADLCFSEGISQVLSRVGASG